MTWLHQTIASDPQLAPRLDTDRLFPMPAGSIGCRGDLDKAASFIAEKQLCDAGLWRKFAAVFAVEPKADAADHGWRGEYWGKMMRGGCITYGYTQDAHLLAVLTDAVTALLDTAEPDGRISSYPRGDEFVSWDMWCRKYVLLGLEYFLQICPDETLSARVTAALCREADGILAAVGPSAGQKKITETSTIWEGVNSSSVLEPVVRLYFITKDKRYLDFATYVVESGGALTENIFETAWRDEKSPYDYRVVKAYETMSCFEGLMEYYRATGIEKWRDAAIRFGRRVAAEEATFIGNCGTLHEIFDHGERSQWRTHYLGVMQETCVAVTYLKFCFQLLCLTGDSRFGDEIERTAYNALLGAINYTGAGLPFDSYAPLNGGLRGLEVGGKKDLPGGGFYGCCAAIGAAGTGLAPQTAALLRPDGVALNLYLPGFVATRTPNGLPLELTVKTDYPGNGVISIQIDTHDEAPFTLALRIPAWSRRTTLTVTGELVAVTPGTFAEIRRTFACGDTVELRLDLRGRVVRPCGACGDPDANEQAALLRGPLALARDARTGQDPMAPPALAADKEGYVETALTEKVTFPHFFAFEARRGDGGTALFTDYASAGGTWQSDSRYAVLFPTEPLPTVDLTRPIRLARALRLDYAHSNRLPLQPLRYLAVRDGAIMAAEDESTAFVPTAVRGDACHLMAGDLCLRFDEEGNAQLSRNGQYFTFLPACRNRYFIAASDGRYLRVQGDKLTLSDHVSPRALFLVENAD